jgi:hypothetical protein
VANTCQPFGWQIATSGAYSDGQVLKKIKSGLDLTVDERK